MEPCSRCAVIPVKWWENPANWEIKNHCYSDTRCGRCYGFPETREKATATAEYELIKFDRKVCYPIWELLVQKLDEQARINQENGKLEGFIFNISWIAENIRDVVILTKWGTLDIVGFCVAHHNKKDNHVEIMFIESFIKLQGIGRLLLQSVDQTGTFLVQGPVLESKPFWDIIEEDYIIEYGYLPKEWDV